MTAEEFTRAYRRLGFPSPYAVAPWLGVTPSQAWRYAAGRSQVPAAVALLLAMYARHGLPEDMVEESER